MFINLIFYLFVGAIFIQIFFLIIFLIKLNGYKPLSDPASLPPVSIVVAARNELDNLKRLLPKLYAQEYPEFEIIVVDDRSHDGSYDFLLNESLKTENLKLVKVTNTPDHMTAKKFALTLGVKGASHNLLLLTDADCYPNNRQWVSAMAKGFQGEKTFVLGVSQYDRRKGLLNAFIRYETLLTAIQYIAMALMGKPYMGVGRNLAYQKQFFLDKKGFLSHQHILGGDDDLFVNQHANKSNTQVVIGNDAMVYSTPKRTWKTFFKQKKRHLSAGKHYKTKDKIILGLFSLTHLMVWLILPALLALQMELYLTISGFFIRILLIFMVFKVASRKFGSEFKTYSLPILDFIYVFYYITAGIAAFFSKRTKWS